jgi:uncharacterized membrane protein
VSTAQIDLTVSPSLNLPVSVLGLATATVKNELPIHVTGAGATGTLKSAGCSGSSGIVVTVDPSAFSGSASATLRATVSSALGNIATVDIPTTNVVPSTNGAPVDLTFNYPTEFPVTGGTATTKHAGSQPVGLSGLTTITAGTPTVTMLGLVPLPVPVASIVTAVVNALSPVIADVDNSVVTPLLQALGVDVGSADVTALLLNCSVPTLVG